MEKQEKIEWLMNTMRGRPSLSTLREKYRIVLDTGSIDETWIGRACVIAYRYPEMICGNWQQDVLYYGRFAEGSYEKYIWIKDNKGYDGRISKARLETPRFVIYIPL
jgi:hypothetical protein